MKRAHQPPPRPGSRLKLVWSRRELMAATGLCYRSLSNLEARGLLHRCQAGVNVALYTHASVLALFGDRAAPTLSPALPSADAVGTTPPESPQNQESHE